MTAATQSRAAGEDIIVHFRRGDRFFEVRPTRSNNSLSYAGYVDGQLSAVAPERHVVARMLLRRDSLRAQMADRIR